MRPAQHGSPLTAILVAASIAAGIALAITCSYRPIALWWVMAGCSAVNLVRFGARTGTKTLDPRLARLKQRFRRRDAAVDAAGGQRAGASKRSLDRQNRRFLIWFAEHNLLWTTVGFAGSLLIWHRFGPMTPALVVMAALMACGVLAGAGAIVGARRRGLGLCWREPCATPDFRSVSRLMTDVGTVLVLRNRHEYAAARDWTTGARFHELFLAIDELDRAGVEPGLAATLHDSGDAARRTLARKERIDRALALAPVFATALVAAALVVPPLSGNEPLPSLWDIVTRGGGSRSASARDAQDDGTPRSANAKPDSKPASARNGAPAPAAGELQQASPDANATAPDASGSQKQTPRDAAASGAAANQPVDGSAQAGEAVPGAGAGTARGDGQGRGDEGGAAAGSGQGSGGRPTDSTASNDGKSQGAGGRGGGPYGYGTSGPAPERAESPAAIPDVTPTSGEAIEVVLPPFSESKSDTPGDDPAGDKRKGAAPGAAPAYQPHRDAVQAPHEATSREPVQRWPNWVFRLLHKPQDR